MSKSYIINCPKCGERIDERELEVNELLKKECPKCKVAFWVLAEIHIRKLVDWKDIKKEE